MKNFENQKTNSDISLFGGKTKEEIKKDICFLIFNILF